jgi:hypothetical protein
VLKTKKYQAKQKKILPFFFLALFFALFSREIFPGIRWLPFAPFLAILCTSRPFLSCLWIGALSGLIMDLLGSELPLGLHALTYALTILILFRYHHYFVDKAIGLVSLTFLFSLLATIIQLGELLLLGLTIPLTFSGIVSDFFFIPLLDALYGFLFFSCPSFLFRFLKKQWPRFLLFKERFKSRKEELSTKKQ